MISLNFAFEQEVQLAPKNYLFSWQKANGDTYEIPVENNLKSTIELKRLDRALMQILLKSLLKSRDFESFKPEQVNLFSDVNNEVAKIVFTILDAAEKEQEIIYYFTFDKYGNVFDQIDL
ncbi:hypothetical protein N9V25_03855 [Flavobacteriaceae bacterium]|nr:hypothetical protein [Flavobacteriaceae bacterium]